MNLNLSVISKKQPKLKLSKFEKLWKLFFNLFTICLIYEAFRNHRKNQFSLNSRFASTRFCTLKDLTWCCIQNTHLHLLLCPCYGFADWYQTLTLTLEYLKIVRKEWKACWKNFITLNFLAILLFSAFVSLHPKHDRAKGKFNSLFHAWKTFIIKTLFFPHSFRFP